MIPLERYFDMEIKKGFHSNKQEQGKQLLMSKSFVRLPASSPTKKDGLLYTFRSGYSLRYDESGTERESTVYHSSEE